MVSLHGFPTNGNSSLSSPSSSLYPPFLTCLVERPMRGAIVRLAVRRVEPSYCGEGATLTEYCVPNPAALRIKNRMPFTSAVTELNISSDSDRLSRA
jgi:hypothetical protein